MSCCGLHIGTRYPHPTCRTRPGDVWPQGDRAFRKAGGRGAKDSQNLGITSSTLQHVDWGVVR